MIVQICHYDPSDLDTYPSVCADPGEVRARFGFTGGEILLFNEQGAYIGQLVKTLPMLELEVALPSKTAERLESLEEEVAQLRLDHEGLARTLNSRTEHLV